MYQENNVTPNIISNKNIAEMCDIIKMIKKEITL